MSFPLDLVEFIFSEVTHWKRISHTESVNGLVTYLSPSAGKVTAVDDPGVVITLDSKCLLLLRLIGAALVTPEVFDCHVIGHMLDVNWISVLVEYFDSVRGIGLDGQHWLSVGLPVVMDYMVLAFR